MCAQRASSSTVGAVFRGARAFSRSTFSGSCSSSSCTSCPPYVRSSPPSSWPPNSWTFGANAAADRPLLARVAAAQEAGCRASGPECRAPASPRLWVWPRGQEPRPAEASRCTCCSRAPVRIPSLCATSSTDASPFPFGPQRPAARFRCSPGLRYRTLFAFCVHFVPRKARTEDSF